jgi:hypothetical protein
MGATSAVRCESAVNFNGGSSAPAGTGLTATKFSARWTSTRHIDVAGTYQFILRADDGAVLFVDGEPVITAWSERTSATTLTASVNLTPGDHAVQLEYFKNQGLGVAQLTYR